MHIVDNWQPFTQVVIVRVIDNWRPFTRVVFVRIVDSCSSARLRILDDRLFVRLRWQLLVRRIAYRGNRREREREKDLFFASSTRVGA